MREQEIRSQQLASAPYERVKDILTTDALRVFHRATSSAVERGDEHLATLGATVAGREIEREVVVEITSIDLSGRPPSAMVLPGVAFSFSWRAADAARMFPAMRAQLTIYPLSARQTAIDLHGWYEPPGGLLGGIGDAIVGHRIAERSVHRFLDAVARRLEHEAT